jgi:hypothetical protein
VDAGTAVQTTKVNKYVITSPTSEMAIMTVDTDAKTVNLNARLIVNNPADFKGEDGWSYDTDLQWGMDGDSTLDVDWFEDYHPSYFWQRSRKYKFIEGNLLNHGALLYV